MKLHSISDTITNSSSEFFIIKTDVSPEVVLWVARIIWATYGNIEAFNLTAHSQNDGTVLLQELGYSWEVPEELDLVLQSVFGEDNVRWGQVG